MRGATPDRTRLARAIVLVGLIALTGTGTVLAYVQSNLVDAGFPDVGLFVQGGSLVFRLEIDGSFRITDGSDITALEESMDRWTNVSTSLLTVSRGADFNFSDPIDAGAGIANDGSNRVYFAETDDSGTIGGAIAVAFFFVGPTGAIGDCDIVFNERLYNFSTTTPGNPNHDLGPSTYDLGEIAIHEMGHCAGLAHSPVAGTFSNSSGLQISGFYSGDFIYQATMYPFGSGTIQGRSLSQDDTSGIASIYPASSLATTTGTLSGRVLDGATGASIRGAHVVAVSTSAPNIPIAGALSDVAVGGPGGDFTIVGLPPGSYYLRIEPMVGTTNPFDESNVPFVGFDTDFPWEFYNGAGETGFDDPQENEAITLEAGQTVSGIDILTNVAIPDPNEPNDTQASATPIACETTMQVSIQPQGDVDFYELMITEPTAIEVDVDAGRSGSSLDAMAALFDATGAELAFADNTISLDPILNVSVFDSGSYYIAVASFNDRSFDGTNSNTQGDYTLTIRCGGPTVTPGVCPGRVLYSSTMTGAILAIADNDGDLRPEGQTTLIDGLGTTLGDLGARRDGGIVVGTTQGQIAAFWDDTGDFVYDRADSFLSGAGDASALIAFRRGGQEQLYAGGPFGGGTVVEILDSNGDLQPDRSTIFTDEPGSVRAIARDEAGTVYVLDPDFDGGRGAIRHYRDGDGDGVADFSGIFMEDTAAYGDIIGRAQGELFATHLTAGRIDRIRDRFGHGAADEITTYASGLALDLGYGLALDDADVLYVVDGGTRVTAIADDDGDGMADRIEPFSPLNAGLTGLTFGATPPDLVSPPGATIQVTATDGPTGLRLTWEDLGPSVGAYNIYDGWLGNPLSTIVHVCH
ncbi:MAG: hypothetical protein O7A63_09360, partial [Acidobacteria bacterium]|nr:hypothetical protein [Acidobacteriota bacterium]